MKDNIIVVFWTLLLVVLFVVTSRNSRADDWVIRGGAGVGSEGISGFTKLIGFRSESQLPWYGLVYANELGGWVDKHEGRKSSLYGKAQLGIRPVSNSGWFAKAFFGPALITSPDSVLGSIPQFSTDVSFGLQDKYNAVSIGYMHISNAGLFSNINKGRDYLLLEAAFGL